jgi:hypothetical protein
LNTVFLEVFTVELLVATNVGYSPYVSNAFENTQFTAFVSGEILAVTTIDARFETSTVFFVVITTQLEVIVEKLTDHVNQIRIQLLHS